MNKESVGVGNKKFEIVLDKNWQQTNTEYYVGGFDDYEKEKSLNFYQRIRKFIGLKYKDNNRACTIFKVTNGVVEYITSRDEK